MIFSSISFLYYFLPIFFVLYAIPRTRNAVLLTASLLFYAWGEVEFVLLLLVSIGSNYCLGLWIDRFPQRRLPISCGIAVNLLLLGYFKYANLLVETFSSTALEFGASATPWDNVHLPLGISFFTFQSMSYLLDIHRGQAKVERNPLSLGLYISMFPQLVAGPIVRFKAVARQIHRRTHTTDRIILGCTFFAIGLAQKVLIANTVAVAADGIFALDAARLSMSLAWLGIVAYTVQIYFDFNGYSNMAIGLGLVMGFKFPRNFNYPYIAESITDFWRRWHISLSSWFRDYLYIPLGGNRGSKFRTYVNLCTVFLLCGLWHGASWTFLFWGIYHGMFLAIERAGMSNYLKQLPRVFRHAYLLVVVMFGWVIFRADNFDHLRLFLSAMLGFDNVAHNLPPTLYLTRDVAIALGIAVLASTPWYGAIPSSWRNHVAAVAANRLFIMCVFALSLIFVSSGTYNPFIYFRF